MHNSFFKNRKMNLLIIYYLVQFSLSVALRSHGLQHARIPCQTPIPGACSSRWCHPMILSSVVLFSSCLQSFPASGSFLVSQFFASGGQSPSDEYSGLISFRIAWLDLLAVQGTLRSLLQRQNSIASILWLSALFIVQLSHPYMTTGKNHSFD